MDKLRAKLFQQIANRVQSQRADFQENLKDRPAIGAGGNLIQRLGGAPFRPTNDLRTSATGSGRPIIYQDGVALSSAPGSPGGGQGLNGQGSYNGQEELDIAILDPKNLTYVAVYSARYRAQVIALLYPEGLPYGVAFSHAQGEVVEIGDSFSVTLSGIDEESETPEDPVSFSVELRRLQ